jgi:hypothetical protein
MGEIGKCPSRPEFFVDEGRAGFCGFKDIEDGRKGLVIDLNELDGILCQASVLCGNGHDWLSNVKDPIDCKDGLVPKRRTKIGIDAGHSRNVGAG